MGEPGKRYSDEEKTERLARYDALLVQAGMDHTRAAKEVGVSPQTIEAWVTKRRNGTGKGPTEDGIDTASARLKLLAAENNKLRRLLLDALTGKIKIIRTDGEDV